MTMYECRGLATINATETASKKFCCHGGMAVRRTRTRGENCDDMSQLAAKRAKCQPSLSQYLR